MPEIDPKGFGAFENRTPGGLFNKLQVDGGQGFLDINEDAQNAIRFM